MNLKEDVSYMATSPARMDRDDALFSVSLIGFGMLIYSQDTHISDFAQDHRTSTLDDIFPNIEPFCNGFYDITFLALCGGSGYLFKKE